MPDPYSEATRNEHGGNFRLSRTILGGGSLALLLIGLVVWITVVVGRSFDQSPEAAAELNFKLATARAAAAGAVLQAPEPRTGLRVGVARGLAAMAWGDRLVSLVVTEDEFGDSLFVLIFKG